MDSKQIASVILIIVGVSILAISVVFSFILNRKNKGNGEKAIVTKQDEIKGLIGLAGIILGLVLFLIAIIISR